MFPIITHINEVLPHVHGRSDFVVAEKDGYTVIDYVYAAPDTFEGPGAEYRRECRGLKFAPDGRLLSRPLHKFMNFGEKPETTDIDWTKPHSIFPKLDGSMIHPTLLPQTQSNDGTTLVFMTRMGITDVANQAGIYASKSHGIDYANFCCDWIDKGYTPIFEYTGPNNRIVIPYQHEALTLIAMRHISTGNYYPLWMVQPNKHYGPMPVSEDRGHVVDPQGFIEWIRSLKGEEGVVIHFNDGLFVKIKADEYVAFHRAKDSCSTERRVLPLVLENKVDDVLPLLSPQDRKELEEYAATVNKAVTRNATFVWRAVQRHVDSGDDRKTLATQMHFAPGYEALKAVAFKILDGADAREALVSVLLKQCTTNVKIDGIRDMIGGVKWRDKSPSTTEE